MHAFQLMHRYFNPSLEHFTLHAQHLQVLGEEDLLRLVAHRRVGRDGGSRSPHRGGTRDRLHQRLIQVQHVLLRRLQHGREGTHGRHGGGIWFALCVLRVSVLRVRLGNLLWLWESASFPPKTTTFSWIFQIFKDILGYFAGFLGFFGFRGCDFFGRHVTSKTTAQLHERERST